MHQTLISLSDFFDNDLFVLVLLAIRENSQNWRLVATDLIEMTSLGQDRVDAEDLAASATSAIP
jgi:hypothetical protein